MCKLLPLINNCILQLTSSWQSNWKELQIDTQVLSICDVQCMENLILIFLTSFVFHFFWIWPLYVMIVSVADGFQKGLDWFIEKPDGEMLLDMPLHTCNQEDCFLYLLFMNFKETSDWPLWETGCHTIRSLDLIQWSLSLCSYVLTMDVWISPWSTFM